MFSPTPIKILYAYSAWQDAFEDMKDVTFHNGLPTRDELEPNMLLVLDDVMHEATSSADVMRMFTIDCHHKCISVLFLVQNMFHKSIQVRIKIVFE